LETVKSYIQEELNVRTVKLTSDEGSFVRVRADPDNRLGKRLRGDMEKVSKGVKELTHDQIRSFQQDGKIEIAGHTLTNEDLKIIREFKGDQNRYEAAWSESVLVVLDCHVDESLKSEGLAREVVNRVQRLRKKAGLQPGEPVEVFYTADPKKGEQLVRAIELMHDFIFEATKLHVLNSKYRTTPSSTIVHEKTEVEGVTLDLYLNNCSVSFNDESLKQKFGEAAEDVKIAVLTRDYFKFIHSFESNGLSSFSLNNKLVEIKLGEDVFLTANDKRQQLEPKK